VGDVDPLGLRDLLGRDLDRIAALTQAMVEIDSPTDEPHGVRRVQEVLAARLVELGADITWHGAGEGREVLDARFGGHDAPVLVLGHADTVWPVGTAAVWPFVRSEGLWTGPGVGDMKACLAVAAHALGAVAAGPAAVRLLVVPDEEAGSVGSRAVIERAAREATACLTLEAARPGGGLVTARAAVGAMRIDATGEARHVTDPEPHRDALLAIAAVAASLPALDADGARARAGILHAGTARQVTAERAELHVDLRAPTTEAAETLAERVRQAARAAGERTGVTVEVAGGVTRPAFLRSDGTAQLYDEAVGIGALLGQPVPEVHERGGSDASFAAAIGVPTLDGLGPICHGSCSREERVEEVSVPVFGAILGTLAAA